MCSTWKPFRDVLEFCWETGCRVQEVRVLEASHYKPDLGRFELPPTQAKGRKRWRLIYFTSRAEEIVKILVLRRPKGPLFPFPNLAWSRKEPLRHAEPVDACQKSGKAISTSDERPK